MTCCVCMHMHMRMYVAYGIGASRKRLRVAAVVHSSSSTRRAASRRRCALGSMHAAARVHGRAACNPRRQRWQLHVPVPRLQPCVPTDRCPLGAPYLTSSISPLSPLYLLYISLYLPTDRCALGARGASSAVRLATHAEARARGGLGTGALDGAGALRRRRATRPATRRVVCAPRQRRQRR